MTTSDFLVAQLHRSVNGNSVLARGQHSIGPPEHRRALGDWSNSRTPRGGPEHGRNPADLFRGYFSARTVSGLTRDAEHALLDANRVARRAFITRCHVLCVTWQGVPPLSTVESWRAGRFLGGCEARESRPCSAAGSAAGT
jgi:hypothetical protein